MLTYLGGQGGQERLDAWRGGGDPRRGETRGEVQPGDSQAQAPEVQEEEEEEEGQVKPAQREEGNTNTRHSAG